MGCRRPKKYDGLSPYEAGKRHYESASPKRAAWLKRASKQLIERLEPDDPDIPYWRGVAGLPQESPRTAKPKKQSPGARLVALAQTSDDRPIEFVGACILVFDEDPEPTILGADVYDEVS